jgi:hypothetical protein
MIISVENCWGSAEAKHRKYFDDVVIRRRKKLENRLPPPCIRFLENNHDNIRDGDVNIFRNIQAKYVRLMSSFTQKRRAEIDYHIKSIFSYTAFSRKNPKGDWCAYSLCLTLGSTTCPYCNLAYGHTLVVNGDGKIRPELDHFFDKASYPLFAISLNNFVPSCHFCNSSLKLSGDFFSNVHLNPLVDKESIEIGLDVDPLLARSNISLFDKANIKLKYDKSDPKALNSVKTFHLEERYQMLVDEAREIARYITTYRTRHGLIKGDLEWAKRGVDAANYKNRVLGKLILDLANTYS